MYEESQEQLMDDSAATLVLIKRALNQGMQKFGAILNREWRDSEQTFDIEADQQYYQMPENCIRPKSIVITIGGTDYPLDEEPDADAWNRLNANRSSERSAEPQLYHVKGSDLFGIWPTPSADVDEAGVINYEARMRRMTAADYVSGTIAVTNDSQTVIGTGVVWTAQMVGRTMIIEDGGDQDGIGYKVAGFTDSTHLSIENYYAGLSAASASYRIGEVPDIPDEFHESLIDYALYRVYKRRKDRGMANDAKMAFDEAIVMCRDTYSSSSSSQYYRPRYSRSGYVHSRRNYTVTGS